MLKDKVAIVTGSGRGLGRAHALALASQGAKVVVNDLGTALDGKGNSASPAEEVVEEIKKAGGQAVASYDSVATSEGADRIIKAAVDKFGRLDILVNNAGIVRDKMVFNLSDEDFDLVLKVNLYGTFYCARAAARVMREQKYGRIINTSSLSALGNVGQANYAAAKEGVIGLTRVLGKDMASFGTTCNAIRPRAATRLTVSDELYEARKKKLGVEKAEEYRRAAMVNAPDDVSPLVVYLASEQAGNITCCVFDVFHNFIAIYDDPPRFAGTIIKEDGRWSPEELAEIMPKTLVRSLERVEPTPVRRITPDARGWQLVNGRLVEVKAMNL